MHTDLDESFKTGRFLHRLLLVACGTIIVFQLSDQRDASEYSMAAEGLTELDSLRRELGRYHTMIGAALDNQAGPPDDLHEAVRTIASELSIDLGTASTTPFTAVFPFRYEAPPFNSSLSDLREFLSPSTRLAPGFANNPEVLVVQADDREFRAAVRSILAQFSDSGGRFVGWRFWAPRFTREAFWKDRENDVMEVCVVIEYTEPSSAGVVKRIFSYPFRAGGVCPPGTYADCITWIEKQGLLGVEGATEIRFPKLRAIWREIEGKSLDEAIPYVEDMRLAQTDVISILGLTMTETSLQVAVPVLLALLLTYLLAHIVHIRRGCEGRIPWDAFPWIALFPDPLSRVLTHTSVLLLPLATTIWLLLTPGLHVLLKVALGASVALCGALLSASLSVRGKRV